MEQRRALQICFSIIVILLMLLMCLYYQEISATIQAHQSTKPVVARGRVGHLKDLDLFPADTGSGLSDDVTIVTSYIDLGTFSKGEYGDRYTPELYRQWLKIFAKMKNPVMAYFVDGELENYFLHIRKSQPKNKTKTVKFSKSESWAFSLKPRIEEIISSPDYPKYHPNTFIAEYGCVMHAKYEMMATTARRNPFRTKHIAWLDTGYFRDLGSNNNVISNFSLELPPQFDKTKVAYTQVGPLMNLTAERVFKENHVFVCGCYFVGTINNILSWTSTYQHRVSYYLSKGLTNTDQQVLYAMAIEDKSVLDKIRLYFTKSKELKWFYLGYISKRE